MSLDGASVGCTMKNVRDAKAPQLGGGVKRLEFDGISQRHSYLKVDDSRLHVASIY